MRVAVILSGLVLVAGCSQVPVTQPGPAELTPITPSRTASAPSTSTLTSPTSPTTRAQSEAAPAAGAPVESVVAWVQAGAPVDDADFRVALRGGTAVPLGEDTAFVTASGISCMTDVKRAPGDLACLVRHLVSPPPQPADSSGYWVGNWVDFNGARVQVGGIHGDPGRFTVGSGAPLPTGPSVSFGDFRCRADATTLVCVNYAHKTGVRYSDAGIDTYGCTRQVPPAAGIGEQYTC